MVIVNRDVVNGTYVTNYKVVIPDIKNDTSRSEVCSSLDDEECDRWTSCCHNAMDCCASQIISTVNVKQDECPQTWDGFSCWSSTNAGSTISQECPLFLEHANPLGNML